MKRSVKGALLSGLVLPGAGQLWLKRYLRGAALIVVVLASFAVMVYKAAHYALSIIEKAEAEGGTVDMVAIVNTATRASSAIQDATMRWAVIIIIVCWVVGVIDAYLAGKKDEEAGGVQR